MRVRILVHPRWTLDERIVESGYIPKCRAGSSDLNATRIPQHQVRRLFAGEQRTAIPQNRGSHDDPFVSASSFRSDASSGAHCFLMKCLSAIQRVEMQRGAYGTSGFKIKAKGARSRRMAATQIQILGCGTAAGCSASIPAKRVKSFVLNVRIFFTPWTRMTATR